MKPRRRPWQHLPVSAKGRSFGSMLRSHRGRLLASGLGVLLLALLGWLFGAPPTQTSSQGTLCREKHGIVRDRCLADLAISADRVELCRSIRDLQQRDHCFLSLSNQNLRKREQQDPCAEISSPVLGYLCMRVQIRPHMHRFLTYRQHYTPSVALPDQPGCGRYGTTAEVSVCRYLELAKHAGPVLLEELQRCRTEFPEPQASECAYYLVVASLLTRGDRGGAPAYLQNLERGCADIFDPSFRSECYYNLADELALEAPAEHLAELAALCRRSDEIENYHCVDHVARLLPNTEMVLELCRILGAKVLDSNCYGVLGEQFILLRTWPTARALATCASLEGTDQAEACQRGVARGSGYLSPPTGRKVAAEGDAIPPWWRDEQRSGMVLAMADRLFLDGVRPETISQCEAFEEPERPLCYRAFFQSILFPFVHHLPEGRALCEELPAYREDCLETLLGYVRELQGRRPEVLRASCGYFPQPHRSRCENTSSP